MHDKINKVKHISISAHFLQIYIYVCINLFIYICMNTYTCIHLGGSQKFMSGVFFHYSSPYILRQGFSTKLELIHFTSLAD